MCRILTTSVPSTTSKRCFEQPAASFLVCILIFIEYKIQDVSDFSNRHLSTFYYATISQSRSVRCETKKPPAMRVRVEGYTPKKLRTRYNKGVQANCKTKGEKYGTKGS